MGRGRRVWISENTGVYHIISRISGGQFLLHNYEKELFLKLLERCSRSFFVRIHAFAIMSNHFHLLISGQEQEASSATEDELIRRYRLIYGKEAMPPEGPQTESGDYLPDEDGGIERLRRRLGSISRFVQELKQGFSRRYNRENQRFGTLWSGRFGSPVMELGDAAITASAYIDLNPVRAGIVARPEEYRWSSMGLMVRNPKRAKKLLSPLRRPVCKRTMGADLEYAEVEWAWYRQFVYQAGQCRVEGKASISEELADEVRAYHGYLGLGDRIGYRMRNLSEGLAVGSEAFIANIQRRCIRKCIKPRKLLSGGLCSTRVLRDLPSSP